MPRPIKDKSASFASASKAKLGAVASGQKILDMRQVCGNRFGLTLGSLILILITFSCLAAATLSYQKMKIAVQYAGAVAGQFNGVQKQNTDLASQVADLETLIAVKNKIEPTPPPSMFLSIPADWQSFMIDKLGLSFSYPKEWGVAAVTDLKTDPGGGVVVAFSKAPDAHLYLKSSQYVPTPKSPTEFSLPSVVPSSCDEVTPNGKPADSCIHFASNNHAVFLYSTPASSGDLYGSRSSAVYYTGQENFPTLVGLLPKKISPDITILGRIFSSIK